MNSECSRKKIGLMGPFGYGNLGDAAIQEAMIQHIRRYYPNAEIYGFSLNTEDTEKRHGIPSFPITRMSWLEEDRQKKGLRQRISNWMRSHPLPILQKSERWIMRAPIELRLITNAFNHLKDLDILIISGGGQLDDYWGGGGPWSHPYTLLKYALLSKLRKCKFFIVSVGAGPLDAKLSQLFTRATLNLADYRSYRDESSKRFIEQIGFKRDDPVYPDLAHSLDINCYNQEKAVHTNHQKVVGIGPIGFFKLESWPEYDPEIYAAYLAKMCAFVTWLIQEQYAILFLPGEAFYDQLVIADLKEALIQNGVSIGKEQLIDREILTLEDLIQSIAITDFVVASRFHNVLLSQLMEKPVLAISYQAKIDSLMLNTDQSKYCLPIATFGVDDLKARFNALKENQEKIIKQVKQHYQDYRKALDQQYDRIFSDK